MAVSVRGLACFFNYVFVPCVVLSVGRQEDGNRTNRKLAGNHVGIIILKNDEIHAHASHETKPIIHWY